MGFRRTKDSPDGPIWAGIQAAIGLVPARSIRDHDRYSPGLHHVAFHAPDRAAVDSFHKRVLQLAARILDPPADYPEYAPAYYAVFLADPDGIKLEYVFTPTWPT
jgi:glyoxylase I family protein